MRKIVYICFFILLFLGFNGAFAQDLKTNVGTNKEMDSVRKKLDAGKDSVVFTAKYIKFTKLALSKDSIILLPLDTSTVNIQNYSPLLQPLHPTISNGNMGLSARPLLYEPSKRIGYDEGYHSLDYYALTPEDIIFYQARTPFTSLYFVSAGQKEQIFRAIHTQNIKPNWNVGLNFNRADSKGFYARQRGDNLNVALFSWYQSPSKRYNMWASAIFNTMRAYENGSVVEEDIFADNYTKIARDAEAVKLSSSRNMYKKNILFLKQSYYVGRIDSSSKASSVLPTNKITYTVQLDNNSYDFYKNEVDTYNVLPPGVADATFTNDSTHVQHLKNEFIYSFFLRAKNSAVIKNELKIDAGIRHDHYNQRFMGIKTDGNNYLTTDYSYQNITILGAAGYRFTSNIDFNLDVQQILQGENGGDYLYEARSNIQLGNKIGRIELGAYAQNQSPSALFQNFQGNHYQWINNDLKNTKVNNLSFNYINDKYGFTAGAKYYLTSNYLYFTLDDSNGTNAILPKQETSDISLIRIDVAKKWSFGKFRMENYVAYQKTDKNAILRTPEFYTYNSIYFRNTFVKVLKADIGIDVRYNSEYENYLYSPATAQFYIDEKNPVSFTSKPIVDVFLKANLKRANLFVKYDFVNQGLFQKGYYTVNRYPMQDALLKFGVYWNFYD
ncbi:putative porin [Pedobacter rhizosphaerae]|uniref:Putative porin n=1 Tax=Pedobacter rhizosphaerae TaxID=390241 RepID=A0A1H9RCA4_9SPHI|nr:putative porin [Pedobacter rhizosphaerae]SER70320.1 Putative porin [Pedobacter rhizosphaerae]